jgi:histidine decarboxylase
MRNLENLVKLAQSNYDDFCDGYAPGSGSYFLGMVSGIGIADRKYENNGSDNLDKIISFDNVEIAKGYIGQINMSSVSSFCGVEGLIWGYDVVKAKLRISKILDNNPIIKKLNIELMDATPLISATESLFGTVEKRRFPLLPGSHVPCAVKKYFIDGPGKIFAVYAIGIPENRDEHACLLMEDCGKIALDRPDFKRDAISNAVFSVLEVGSSHKIKYKKILYYYEDAEVLDDQVGCALIALPYFKIAKRAIPQQNVSSFTNLTLEAWEKKVHDAF